ncbi:phosphodiesterase [Tepidimonas sp.]|uniref:phosphodiesterase n=1 Tax=Tepidimonas sp. TaxID=2002775 RepID=UPI002FDFDAD6
MLLPEPFILTMPNTARGTDPHSVRGLIAGDGLRMHLQPIIELASQRVFGHEALVRTRADCAWRTPEQLFAAAAREGCTLELELACVRTALGVRQQETVHGLLFINVSATALVQRALDTASQGWQGARQAQTMPLAGVVLELTEHERVHDLDALQQALALWRGAGAALALDDFGDGRSSLRLWSELRPEYVKIDKYFTQQVHENGHKLQTLRALQHLADTFGAQLVAEGVEHADELRVLRDMGIPLAQGYLFGRPEPAAVHELPPPALAVLREREIAVLPEGHRVVNRSLTARTLLITAPALTPRHTNEDALELFRRHPHLNAVAIVDGERAVGLLARRTLQEQAMHRYFRELRGRNPCLTLANRQPLCVEVHTPIEHLTEVLTSADQTYLRDGFILTDHGRYVGLGTGEQLVRRVTEARIEAARHANPLTSLPGNVPLTLHIERLLQNGEPFTACYADLNHFKAFNDHYGYWRGDEMIRLQARCLSAACDPRRDFIGHVGGDDFVLLMQSPDWEQRLLTAVHSFNEQARALYDEAARAAGGIMAEDRHGTLRFHPLTTVSIGVLRVQPGHYRTAEQVASAAAHAKHQAKLNSCGLYRLDSTPASTVPSASGAADDPVLDTAAGARQ